MSRCSYWRGVHLWYSVSISSHILIILGGLNPPVQYIHLAFESSCALGYDLVPGIWMITPPMPGRQLLPYETATVSLTVMVLSCYAIANRHVATSVQESALVPVQQPNGVNMSP